MQIKENDQFATLTPEQLDHLLQEFKRRTNEARPPSLPSACAQLPTFPISISSVAVCLHFAILSIYILHTFSAFVGIIDTLDPTYTSSFSLSSLFTSNMSSFGCLLIIVLETLLAISLVFPGGSGESFLLLNWLGAHVFLWLRDLVEINLALSALFLSNGSIANIFPFVIAVGMALFTTIQRQNATVPKDYFCCLSLPLSLAFRLGIVICYVCNWLFSSFAKTISGLISYVVVNLVVSLVMYISYFAWGVTLYRQDITKRCFYLTVTLQMSLALAMTFDTYLYVTESRWQIYVHLIAIFPLLLFLTLKTNQNMGLRALRKECLSLKEKTYYILKRLADAETSSESDCQIRGLLKEHIVLGCNNVECFLNISQQELYDSKTGKACFIDRITHGKTGLTKFYVRCLYHQAIQNHPDDSELLLQYLEMLYFELRNTFLVVRHIHSFHRFKLDHFQQLRLDRLKLFMCIEAQRFTEEMYLGKLHIERVIHAEEVFARIQVKEQIVLERSELFWKYVSGNEIDLEKMLGIARENMQLVESIGEDWAGLTSEIELNRRWKFNYLLHLLYIKNEKLKPNHLQDFGNSVEFDLAFRQEGSFFQKTAEKEVFGNSKMLYEPYSCYLHCKPTYHQPIVTRVSWAFAKHLGYTSSEVLLQPLEKLMTKTVAAQHQSALWSWGKLGRSNNQSQYKVKKIFPKGKDGFIVPMFKIYKQLLNSNCELEFIAMLKKNKHDQHWILANANMSIEAFTASLAVKLGLSSTQYEQIQQLNLLILLPNLSVYTPFRRAIVPDISKSVQAIQIGAKNQVSSKKFDSLLKSKKPFPLAGVSCYLPNSISDVLAIESGKVEPFDVISDRFTVMQALGNYKKFKVNLQVCLRGNGDSLYYQIQCNDLEEDRERNEESKSQCLEMGISQKGITLPSELDASEFKKIVLFPSENIFLKEEHNKTLPQMAHIATISGLLRLILLLFLFLVLLGNILQWNFFTSIQAMTQQYALITHYHQLPFLRSNDLTLYNISNYPGFLAETQSVQLEFTSITNDDLFQSILYSLAMNKIAEYPPYTTGEWLDQITLPIKIHELMVAQVAPNSELFQYLLPSFDQLARQIRSQINGLLQKQQQSLHILVICLYSAQLALLLVAFFIGFSRLLQVVGGFIELLSIFPQIDNANVRRITHFATNTSNLFRYLSHRNFRMVDPNFVEQRPLQISSILPQEQEESFANLNKKIKRIELGQEILAIKRKSIVLMLAFFAFIGICSVILNILLSGYISQIDSLWSQGVSLLSPFPASTIALGAVYEKTANFYIPARYKSALQALLVLKQSQIPVAISSGSSIFSQATKQVYFTNLCETVPSLFPSPQQLQFCLNINSQALQFGLQNYINDLVPLMISYLTGTKPLKEDSLIAMHKGCAIISASLTYLLELWCNEVVSSINNNSLNFVFISIAICCAMIISHFILIEWLIIHSLASHYQTLRQLYNHYIPDFVITNEKIIKAKLIKEGFVKA